MSHDSSTSTGAGPEPDPVDRHVGARIRLRRHELGVTQERLAKSLGLTFQQVQKYERGSNRVSASKLFQIAQTLKVPVSYFFDSLRGGPDAAAPANRKELDTDVLAFLSSAQGASVAAAFPRLSRKMQTQIAHLIEALANEG